MYRPRASGRPTARLSCAGPRRSDAIPRAQRPAPGERGQQLAGLRHQGDVDDRADTASTRAGEQLGRAGPGRGEGDRAGPSGQQVGAALRRYPGGEPLGGEHAADDETAPPRGDDPSEGREREPAEVHAAQPLPGHDARERIEARRGPEGVEQADGLGIEAPRGELEHAAGGWVEPLDVVDGDDQRADGREGAHEAEKPGRDGVGDVLRCAADNVTSRHAGPVSGSTSQKRRLSGCS